MDYQQIETFLAIANTRSLSDASEILFISQSTVTYRLKALEDSLGVKLIERERGKKNIELTNKGKEFLNIAKRWKSVFHETESWKVKKSTYELDIGAIDSLNTTTLGKLYKRALLEDPQLRINVSTHWTVTIYQMLENHELDLGFALWELPYRNIEKTLIFSEKMLLISSIQGKLPDKINVLDLDPEKEVYMYHGPEFESWHETLWYGRDIHFSSVDTVGLLIQFIDSTDFWSIVPESVARKLSDKTVKISEIENKAPSRKCYLLSHKSPSKNKKESIASFIDLTTSFFSNP